MRRLVGDAVTLYSDPGARAIEQMGIREVDDSTDRVVARPTVFIIDDLGIVRYRYVGRAADDRPKVALLILACESLRA